MSEIVLYGGTFNPIHNGHIGVCRYLTESLGVPKLLLIPAASPPHKEAPALARAEDRLAVCRLAAAELPGVEVLDTEILRGGRSYTIDTVRELSARYPEDTLLLLVGSDMFLTFRQWRDWRGIGERAALLVASRQADDRELLLEAQASLAADGIVSRILENPVIQLSSTQVREALARGEGQELLPTPVFRYIREQGMYGSGYCLAALRETIRPLMTADRYHHSLCVERQAAHLAELHGFDANKAAAAGILHDICKNMPHVDLLQMLKNSGIMYGVDFETQPQLMHGFAGALYIKDRLGVTDEDILNAVGYHTTARAGMSRLEQIIYLADLTSQERDYTEANTLRETVERSLEEAMLCSLEHMVKDYLPNIGVTVCADTAAALEEYRAQYKNKNGGSQ